MVSLLAMTVLRTEMTTMGNTKDVKALTCRGGEGGPSGRRAGGALSPGLAGGHRPQPPAGLRLALTPRSPLHKVRPLDGAGASSEGSGLRQGAELHVPGSGHSVHRRGP